MQKELRKYHIIQYLLLMVLCLSFLWTENETLTWLTYTPLLMWIVYLIIFGMEFLKQKAKKRLVLVIISSLLIAVLFPDFNLMNMMSIFAGSVNLITLLIVMLKKGTLTNAKASPNTLPVGIFSKKHEKQNLLLIGMSLIIAIAMYLALDYLFQMQIVISIIIVFIVVLLFILIGSVLINPLQKALNKFHMDLNYEAFMQTLNEIKQHNLHPDSLIYIDMVANNYLNLVDLEKAKNEFKDINIPTFKNYLIFYRMFEIIYHVNCEDFQQSQTLLAEFKTDFKTQKPMALSLERSIKIYLTQEMISDVEKFYPINHKKKLVGLINANLLMIYYFRRRDFAKAQFYAEFIQNNTQTLKQMLLDSQMVLEKLELIEVLKVHAKKYPLMEAVDVLKLVYQNEMGGGHLIENSEASLSYLQKEFKDIQGVSGYGDEEIGNGLMRLSLYSYHGSLESLNERFVESSKLIKGTQEGLKAKLQLINDWLKETNPFVFSADCFAEKMHEYLALGCPLVSHSDSYRNNYRPSYRVVMKLDIKRQNV